MHIIFNPPTNAGNKYIDIMSKSLTDAGYQVHDLDGVFSSLAHFRSIQLVHLNWFENVDGTSYTKALISFFRKMIVLTVLRLSRKKLVWTMHNRVTHEKGTAAISNLITTKLIRYADAIIIHSELSRSLLSEFTHKRSNIHYIPHPDYIDVYGPVVNRRVEDNKLKLLFIGAIKPYKNIELLLQVVGEFRDTVTLTLAGNPHSEAYRSEIIQMAEVLPGTHLLLEFIPDDQLPALIGDCDLLILPYDLESGLNSGTVMLAFSYKKTVICPLVGTLSDMHGMKDSFLSYQYGEASEHKAMLTAMVSKAIQMKKEDPAIFDKMGTSLHSYVQEVHNKGRIGDQLTSVYRSLPG